MPRLESPPCSHRRGLQWPARLTFIINTRLCFTGYGLVRDCCGYGGAKGLKSAVSYLAYLAGPVSRAGSALKASRPRHLRQVPLV
ncbi:hypothetical protein E2C01_035224 [Portunus trituberculatus]|uniref:Uncharacterized protein n=1 Tax=Portunus trituberculatus TaxID=210409 RepID=A0A5B7F970_PORTR|nr:hypothetical protein [Portunus trituberculatus]